MANNDLLTCPLCLGRAQIRRADLIALLSGRNLKETIENNLAELVPEAEPVGAAVSQNPERDFQKEVHSWNPQLPIWRRSPKE